MTLNNNWEYNAGDSCWKSPVTTVVLKLDGKPEALTKQTAFWLPE